MIHSFPAYVLAGVLALGNPAPSPEAIARAVGPAPRARKALRAEPFQFGNGRPTRRNRKRTLSQASRKAKRRSA